MYVYGYVYGYGYVYVYVYAYVYMMPGELGDMNSCCMVYDLHGLDPLNHHHYTRNERYELLLYGI